MTVSIELTVTQSIEPGNLYQVKMEVTDSVDISPNIFVFKTEDASFSHVSTPYDLINIPYLTQGDAQTAGSPYYRLVDVTKDYETISLALEFSSYSRSRVAWLVNEYQDDVDTFEGVTVYTYPVP